VILSFTNLLNHHINSLKQHLNQHNCRESNLRLVNAVVIDTRDANEVFHKGDVGQGGEGICQLEEEDLGDQVVLVLGIGSVVLVVVEDFGEVQIAVVQRL
jgi:hypothetical protein